MDKVKRMITIFGWMELLLSAAAGIFFVCFSIDVLLKGGPAVLSVIFSIPFAIYSVRLFIASIKVLRLDNSGRIKILKLHTSALFFCVPAFLYFFFFTMIMFFSNPKDLSMSLFALPLMIIIVLFGCLNYLLTSSEANDFFK